MKSSLLLLSVLLTGCTLGRQASITNSGRIASADDRGTSIAGIGRIGPEAEDVAWSPDGNTLAYSTKNGTILWPKGDRIPELNGKLSWSRDGKSLAGDMANSVAIWDSTSKHVRDIGTLIPIVGIRWMPDGHVLEVDSSGFQAEGKQRVIRDDGELFDAAPQKDGSVVWLESGPTTKLSEQLGAPLLEGRWMAINGTVKVRRVATIGNLLGTTSRSRLAIPSQYAFTPNGRHYAVGGMIVDSNPRSIARMQAFTDARSDASSALQTEYLRLSGAARKVNIVKVFDEEGHSRTVWSESVLSEENGVTDLAWSNDGHWLAIARAQGVARIKVEL